MWANQDLRALDLFRTYYDTLDGTAVQYYIHVTDLADAYVTALLRLNRCGHSVQGVISMVEQVGRRKVPVNDCPRRAGDPPMLVANPDRACRELAWASRLSSLQQIVETAWGWHKVERRTAARVV